MNKTALITGTTSGIGYSLCQHFAQNKINLFLVSRNEAKLSNQKKELQSLYNIKIETLSYDLTKPNAAEYISQQLEAKNIQIDYLVNNAGFNEIGNFLNTDLTNELNMLQLQIVFITKLTKYLLPHMVKRSYGRILNIASTGSYIPCPHNIIYTATKSYLLAFSKGLSADLKRSGVTVTAVCPGATKSNFAKKAGIEHSFLFKYFVMDANTVAKKSYQALMAGKKVKIVGLYNKLLVLASFALPDTLINKISLKMLT
ncbi:short-subunit dehydrogenase [Enterococcus sp. PF1-24]|uniref:SDR family NAD(P)-dependent oxidoreductase n=1 Tax=unclassified Enterococcus TaxID=2608891 RepID=UPI002474ED6A|nr:MULTISPECIES: SDR family oxidoreductase [unclassified Enterococcus]MDH6365705.1 short-subunit dehydrogenase [Enterococcus sp. PFB1-1]MDH6402795.1 short-subunit dehydrogenase [Enterococcus sp. PF1-24]